MYSTLLMVRKYVSNVTMSKLVSTLVSHSTQGDPRYDRSSTMCPWTWGKVCGIRTRSWRLATPRKTLENDDFTDLRILGGRARSGGRVRHASGLQLTAGWPWRAEPPARAQRLRGCLGATSPSLPSLGRPRRDLAPPRRSRPPNSLGHTCCARCRGHTDRSPKG